MQAANAVNNTRASSRRTGTTSTRQIILSGEAHPRRRPVATSGGDRPGEAMPLSQPFEVASAADAAMEDVDQLIEPISRLEYVKALLKEYRALSHQPLVLEELRGRLHPDNPLEDITATSAAHKFSMERVDTYGADVGGIETSKKAA